MDSSTESASAAGLCAACSHAEAVTSARGSVFLLCGRSRTDGAYVRYPRLPVLSCPGYEGSGAGAEG